MVPLIGADNIVVKSAGTSTGRAMPADGMDVVDEGRVATGVVMLDSLVVVVAASAGPLCEAPHDDATRVTTTDTAASVRIPTVDSGLFTQVMVPRVNPTREDLVIVGLTRYSLHRPGLH